MSVLLKRFHLKIYVNTRETRNQSKGIICCVVVSSDMFALLTLVLSTRYRAGKLSTHGLIRLCKIKFISFYKNRSNRTGKKISGTCYIGRRGGSCRSTLCPYIYTNQIKWGFPIFYKPACQKLVAMVTFKSTNTNLAR